MLVPFVPMEYNGKEYAKHEVLIIWSKITIPYSVIFGGREFDNLLVICQNYTHHQLEYYFASQFLLRQYLEKFYITKNYTIEY